MGKLTPIYIGETMPNDTFHLNAEVMLRLAPLLAPIMHRVNVYVHGFFVPNRLIWDEKQWELFITGGRLGTETPPVPPNMAMDFISDRASNYLDKGSLADYLGIPNITDSEANNNYAAGVKLDLLPFGACYKVWYDYYRDRNYVADNDYLPMASGNSTNVDLCHALFSTKYRAWEHDYFTSALPWTQRGDEVLMPLSGTGSVTYLPTSQVKTTAGGNAAVNTLLGSVNGGGPTGDLYVGKTAATTGGGTGRIENIDEVLLSSSDVSINDLRRSVRLQEWLERNALAGSRYSESIYAHFGRRTSDARLQRAEYLGGGKVSVKISEVVTTAFSADSADQVVPPASMSGHGISFGNTNRIHYNCEEHGFIVLFMSVMPTSGYMQGIPRMFSRRNTFLDYPWPSFANLGEQEVYTNEVYMDPTTFPLDRDAAQVFGYQSRYADWKYQPSSCHGDFRSSLDFWHLTRKFASAPVLGDTFVKFEDALQDRVFAVSGVDTLWCYIYNDIKAKRSLPYFGTPML